MKKTLLSVVFAFICFIILTSGIEDNNGKAGRAGSPGEQTCVNGCHQSYALNSGPGSVALTSNMVNDEYTPGQTYTMNLTVTQTGVSLFGLGLEALTAANTNAGTLTAGTGSTIKSATVSGTSRKSITHTLNGGSGTSGMHTFTFTWTAPATGTGNVTFYFSGVAANGNNSNSLDYVYNSSKVFTEYVTPSAVNEVTNVSSLSIFPNPAKDELNINYALVNSEKVTATIYSLNGELVTRLNETNETSGEHLIHSNISSLSKGVYLLELKAGNQIQTKKIVVE